MLDVEDESLLKYIDDYRLKILEPVSMSDEEIEQFKSELQKVFYFIKYSNEKDKLGELINGNESFQYITRETADLINKVTNAGIVIPEREENVDMCKAIQEMREESKAEGIAIGKETAKKEMCIAIEEMREESFQEGKQNILFKLVQKGFLTIEKAASELDMTVEQFKATMTNNKTGLQG